MYVDKNRDTYKYNKVFACVSVFDVEGRGCRGHKRTKLRLISKKKPNKDAVARTITRKERMLSECAKLSNSMCNNLNRICKFTHQEDQQDLLKRFSVERDAKLT